ncbi:MAG: PIN domain-containing protein [Thermofilaceae archaeon]
MILGDTVCVWALYFRNSAYRDHVLQLRREHGLAIPEVCLIEAAYPIFKVGGVQELLNYARFVKGLLQAPRIRVIEFELADIGVAAKLVSANPHLFIDRSGNLNLFDALVAAAWLRTGLTLASSDEVFLELSEAVPELKGRFTRLEKRGTGGCGS